MTNPTEPDDLVERISDEADLCRNDGANDIADLLDETKARIEAHDKLIARLQYDMEICATWLDGFDSTLGSHVRTLLASIKEPT